jgi:hypothetical protein
MSWRRLSALCLLTVMAGSVSAGEVKCLPWPTHFVPVDLTTIPVTMDIGYWVEIVNQSGVVKLLPVDARTYQGRLDLQLRCNFNLTLSCVVASTGAVPGRYTCWFENGNINAPRGTARLYVRLENADLTAQAGGLKDIHVATVTVRVVPRV